MARARHGHLLQLGLDLFRGGRLEVGDPHVGDLPLVRHLDRQLRRAVTLGQVLAGRQVGRVFVERVARPADELAHDRVDGPHAEQPLGGRPDGRHHLDGLVGRRHVAVRPGLLDVGAELGDGRLVHAVQVAGQEVGVGQGGHELVEPLAEQAGRAHLVRVHVVGLDLDQDFPSTGPTRRPGTGPARGRGRRRRGGGGPGRRGGRPWGWPRGPRRSSGPRSAPATRPGWRPPTAAPSRGRAATLTRSSAGLAAAESVDWPGARLGARASARSAAARSGSR